MLAGYLPFDDDPANPEGDNINLLYKYIVSTPLTFPEYVTPHARDLLRRILVPDPRKRADLFEVARHSWLSEYAHVVAHVTSSTTTVGDIANATVTAGMNSSYTVQNLAFSGQHPEDTHRSSSVAKLALTKSTEDHSEGPLLARSASVREPTKPYPANMSPVGGLNHQQGKIDPDHQGEKPKPQRDAKRRTVQVEYVAPQSQTVRGEPRPSPASPTTAESHLVADVGASRTRARAGSQGPVDAPRQTVVGGTQTASKPLPMGPPSLHDSGPVQTYEATIAQGKGQQRPPSSHQGMPPPARPGREVPRSVSDSTGAFGSSQATAPTMARPNTGGSMSSTGNGRFEMRLPSRGSYGQPVAPTVAATNAQGRLAQPKTSKQFVISSPIQQQEMDNPNASIGRPSAQQMSPTYDQGPPPSVQNQPQRGHKRSNTVGGIGEKIFGRSNSIFGGRPEQDAQEPARQKPEKKYPPVSMENPTASDAPRRSTDSRRSTSFGFGRKTSDLGKGDKPRRFSLLPASFSFKSFGAGSKDQTNTDKPMAERKSYAKPPGSRGQTRPMAFGQGQSRSTSYSTEDGVSAGFDGQRDRTRGGPPQQVPRSSMPPRSAPQPQRQQQYVTDKYPSQQGNFGGRPPYPGQSYLQTDSAPPTESDSSLNLAHHQPNYPPGFNSYDNQPRPSMQQGRGPGVLQKNNRKFADVYEQDQEPGYGAGGHHGGSSGAARKVMDFFRRRGKARAAADR